MCVCVFNGEVQGNSKCDSPEQINFYSIFLMCSFFPIYEMLMILTQLCFLTTKTMYLKWKAFINEVTHV